MNSLLSLYFSNFTCRWRCLVAALHPCREPPDLRQVSDVWLAFVPDNHTFEETFSHLERCGTNTLYFRSSSSTTRGSRYSNLTSRSLYLLANVPWTLGAASVSPLPFSSNPFRNLNEMLTLHRCSCCIFPTSIHSLSIEKKSVYRKHLATRILAILSEKRQTKQKAASLMSYLHVHLRHLGSSEDQFPRSELLSVIFCVNLTKSEV